MVESRQSAEVEVSGNRSTEAQIPLIAFLQNYMNAVERITQYSHGNSIDQEASHEPTVYPLPKAWPTKGTLELNDVVMSYRNDLPPVLKGISMSIRDGEKIGVVGRTGAGKTVSFPCSGCGDVFMSNSRLSPPYIGSRSCLLGQSLSMGEQGGPRLSIRLTSDSVSTLQRLVCATCARKLPSFLKNLCCSKVGGACYRRAVRANM